MKTPRLTLEQVERFSALSVPDREATPCRFLIEGRSMNIVSGEVLGRGVHVIHQIVYWNFTRATAREIAALLGCKVVFDKQ